MIRLRTAALGLALSLVAGMPALAQGGPPAGGPPGGGRGMGVEMLLQGIELTDPQKDKLKVIQEKFAPENKKARDAMMAAREKGERPTPEQMQAIRDLAQKERDEVRAVLTTEQQVKFDANLKEMQERMQRRAPPPGGR
jgi:Spy/CpxP family protein refolding chaperone